MATGFLTTVDVLSRSTNEAVADLLLPGLDSADPMIRLGMIRAILARRHLPGQKDLIRRFDRLEEDVLRLLAEHGESFSQAVRDAVLNPDPQTYANGCQALVLFQLYDLLPTLITAIEGGDHQHGPLLSQTALRLVDSLYEELVLVAQARPGRDPRRIRDRLLGALESSVHRFQKHRCRELVECYLVITPRDNPGLLQILRDPRHPSYQVVIDLLMHSERPGVIRLLLNNLDDQHPSTAMLSILGRRSSRRFIPLFMRKLASDHGPQVTQNLRRVEHLTWLSAEGNILDSLEEAEQCGAVRLAAEAHLPADESQAVLNRILANGKPAARVAAIEAWGRIEGPETLPVLQGMLNDHDPQVQAAAIRQMRQHGTAANLPRLVELSSSPHEIIREAVREALTEFRFARYLAAFDAMEEQTRRTTGALVLKIDPDAPQLLSVELGSPARSRRLRAVQIAQAMGAVPEVEPAILQLMWDEDHLLRAATAEALATGRGSESLAALQAALRDVSPLVGEAAQRALSTRLEVTAGRVR